MRLRIALAAAAALMTGAAAAAPAEPLPTGQKITPMAARGARFEPLAARTGPHPDYVSDGAGAMSLSPDGRWLAVLTSGYNRFNGPDGTVDKTQSVQYLFLYALTPRGAERRQTLTVPNAFSGLAWRPDGRGFYVGGGVDDVVHAFRRVGERFEADGAPIPLGHKAGLGVDVKPQTAGVAVSPDGSRLLAANYYNDSVSLIDLNRRVVLAERDLRPGRNPPAQVGEPGGEFPFAVVWRDDGRAYVSAPRDREIVALSVGPDSLRVAARIRTLGEPTALLIDPARKRLYAAQDNADRLAILDLATERLLGEPRLGFPEAILAGETPKGLNPNALALTPEGRLLITYGGANALALAQVEGGSARILGVAPTGWYPSAVAASPDGRTLMVANRKSPPGPNPAGCGPRRAVDRGQPRACGAANQYIFQLEKAGLLQFPTPTPRQWGRLSLTVAENVGLHDGQARAQAQKVMAALRGKIRHVIFVVKENRTYDQVLGDLEKGDGDASLAILGEPLSPNHHALARRFVTFDRFFNSGEQSSTGWTWTTAGRTTDLLEKTAPVGYAGRGLAYESEGTIRGVNVSLPIAERRRVNPAVPDDPDLLPGPRHLTSPDGRDDDEEGQGFLWYAALKAGLTVRNYGFHNDLIYGDDGSELAPLLRDPFAAGKPIYVPADRALAKVSDPYFRPYDQKFPDFWRVKEWAREFDHDAAAGTLANLSLVRISHDHFGAFDKAIDGINTVETQMADNDYALGLIVERVAKSPVRDSTLIFVIEDDAQNGADHVDARRSMAFIIGPYVRQGALISTRYTTVHMLRTIGSILGLPPLGLNDAMAAPMADAFDLNQKDWSFEARPSEALRATQLPIDWRAFAGGGQALACPQRDAAYWTAAMAGQDFRREDELDTDAFNAALWRGLAAGPEPLTRSGKDFRAGRTGIDRQRPTCPADLPGR